MICENCVKLDSLKAFIKSHLHNGSCSYCGSKTNVTEKELLFNYIKSRLEDSLVLASDLSDFEQAMIFECGSPDPHIFPIWEYLADAGDVASEEVISELLDWLPESFNVDGSGNEALFVVDDGTLEKGNDYEEEWTKFVETAHHNHRFFNTNAEAFLDDLFSNITFDGQLKEDIIKELCTDQALYRARTANNIETLKRIESAPYSELGPVPNKLAGNQRMTPAGISAMYCSLERHTCLSEIRAIVGDLVISGKFNPVNPIRLIDLSALKTLNLQDTDKMSMNFLKKLHSHSFFEEMVFQLSRPVGPQDNLGYISTQLFFEYLRVRFNDEVDGILFSSVQTGGEGTNVALFPESSVVLDEINELQDYKNLNPKLSFVADSLRFHKIQSITLTSQDDDSSYIHKADDLVRRRLFGRHV